MCNKLHGNVKTIKKTGFGYKIFVYNPFESKHKFKPMFPDGKESFKSKGINKRDLKFKKRGVGFCFFLTERGAKSYLSGWHYGLRQIFKIKYRKGLGKVRHHEGTFSLCKEFQILENEK